MMEKVQYVSFDIYNTLIGRLYSTETLYRMIGEKIQLDGLFQMADFSAKRIEAEKILAAQGKRYYGIWNIYSTGVFADLDDQKWNCLIRFDRRCGQS